MGSQNTETLMHSDSPRKSSVSMENLLGLLRIRLKKGVNLAVRNVRTSDPYIVIRMGTQRMKTRVVKKDINPEWNEDFTLSVSNPSDPVILNVYDHDTFSMDDSMGEAEFDIRPFMEALKLSTRSLPNNTRIKILKPSRSNCLAEESCVVWRDGQVVQDMCLRLRNVERGELELQLQWVDLPGSKNF